MRTVVRLIWANTLLIVMAAGALVATASTAHASEGGCNTYSTHGFSIGVCVNDEGSDFGAFPDIYVNSTPSSISNCAINISVWDSYNNRYSSVETSSCAKGHYVGNEASPPDRQPRGLHAFARLDYNGAQYAVGDSPGIAVFVNGGVTCYARSCLGLDPAATNCANDAHDVVQAEDPDDGAGNVVTMRRSDNCNAKWAKWTGFNTFAPSFWIRSVDGTYLGSTGLHYSPMVDGSKQATVCTVGLTTTKQTCASN
jgi:hypothetical protein